MDVERSGHAEPDLSAKPGDRPATGATEGRRVDALALVVVALFAFVTRVVVAARNPVLFDDGPDFIDIARAMARGDFGSALSHPFHPLYSALIWWTPGSAGHEEWVGVAWSVLAGTSAVILLAWLMRPLFGRRISVVAAALLAAHPYAVRMSSDVQSDGVYLALFLLGLGAVQRAVSRGDPALAFVAGIASALAYLTRPEGLGIVVVGGVLLLGYWVQRRISARQSVLVAASICAGFALLAVPYMRVIWLLSGEWQLTQKKSLLALVGLGHVQAGAWLGGAALGGVVLAFVLAAWLRRKGAFDSSALRAWRPTAPWVVAAFVLVIGAALAVSPAALVEFAALFASTLRPELLLLLLIGIVASAVRGGAPAGRPLFFVSTGAVYGVATFGLLVTSGYLSRRHLLPVAVVGLGHAALGIDVIAGYVAGRSDRKRAHRVHAMTLIALVLACVVIAAPKVLRTHREEAVAARQAAEWVRSVAAPGDRMATDRPRTAYYAGLVWVPIRSRDVPDGVLHDGADLRRLGVRWVVAGKRELVDEDGSHYAAPTAPGQWFELVHETEQHGFRALVFEVHEGDTQATTPPD